MPALESKLSLDAGTIARARDVASRIAGQVHRVVERHTTVATERAVARLLGVDGVTPEGVPWPNRLVEARGREQRPRAAIAPPRVHGQTRGRLSALGRGVNPVLSPREEVRSKLEDGHQFFTSVLTGEKSL